MTALSNNVVFLNSEATSKNVYAAIRTFLMRKAQESENTANTYLRHYRDFFRTMRGKELEELTEEDLIFLKPQIEAYQVELRKHHKANTVNNTMSALKSLYRKLKDYGFNVDPNWFTVERYKEYDKDPYDSLSHEEVIKIIELVGKTRKGFEKQLLIRVAYATAFRLQEIMNLKWSDLERVKGVWTLKTIAKDKKIDIKKISDDLYNDLMKLKESRKEDSEYIFTFNKKTIDKMMKYIRENMDFGNRTIVFHSFKKASINRVGVLTNGDIKAMQRHGNHASAKTTMDNYAKEVDLDEMVIVDVDTKVDYSKIESMSKEQLIALIKSLDMTTQIKVLQKANEF